MIRVVHDANHCSVGPIQSESLSLAAKSPYLYRLIINNILYSFCIPPTAAQRVAMLLDQMSWLTLTKWSAVE